MSRVAILSPSLATADAVSNDALGMFDVLERHGYDVRLFCESHSLRHSGIAELARIEKFLKGPADILLYHYSKGWDRGLQLIKELRCRRVIKYHNVTPAKFFAGFSDHEQQQCEIGRKQLVDLAAAQCDLYLSDSAFNMQELIAVGADASKSFVVPPFHHIDRLSKITADQETVRKYSDGAANVLSVGRVVPNKSLHHLIELFAHYHLGCNKNSRLIILGKGGEGFSPYPKLLHRLVDRLGLQDSVVFTGGVSDEVLKAYYLVADVFVTVSEHEGFCVPLVEAMSMNVPVTAYASTAIPETLGDAGLVWNERNPLLIVESIDHLLRDTSVRKALAERGRRRYESMFSNDKVESALLGAMATLQ